MKVKQKITNILLVIAFIAVCVPGNAEVWDRLFRFSQLIYRIYGLTEVYTICPDQVVVKEEPKLYWNKWSCSGHSIPTSAVGDCGVCRSNSCDTNNPQYGDCCIEQKCAFE